MNNNFKRCRIYIGADHNGFKLKESLKKFLANRAYDVKDLGNTKYQPSDDYPDYARKVSKYVAEDKQAMGIVICGSGQGMCMVANRYKGIRAALGWSLAVAKKSRQDNNSNILCLPAQYISKTQATRIVHAWLTTPFSKLVRHQRRVKKI